MNQSSRVFLDKPAAREATPLLIALMGPSSGGKTFSALRLATGIQRVCGGDIGFVDTEARRALHYAEMFKFRHIDFKAPFGPLDYLAAIQHFVNNGVKVVIVDSMSHEHDNIGGVLDQHDTIMGGVESKSMIAWKKPKAERRQLINSVLQMNVNFIFCFRAKEKIKPVRNSQGKMEMVQQGWMPIAGEEFIYEQTLSCLLLPKSGGVPDWNPIEPGERMMVKLPEQFFSMFKQPRPLDEATGQALAEWAKGGVPRPVEQSNAEPIRNTGGTGSAHGASENRTPADAAQPASLPADGADRTSDLSPGGPCAVEGPIKFGKSTNAAYWNIVCCDLWLSYKHGSYGAQAKAIETAYKANPGCNFHIEYIESPWEKNGKSGINRTIVHMEPM